MLILENFIHGVEFTTKFQVQKVACDLFPRPSSDVLTMYILPLKI